MRKLILLLLLSAPMFGQQITTATQNGPANVFTNTNTFSTANVKTLNNILLADQWCTTAGVYDGSCFSNAITALAGASGEIIASNHAYTSTGAITCAGTAFTVNQRIIGVSNGTTGGTVVTFTGATNGFVNCELVDMTVSTTNAGGLAAVFQSGLHQEVRNVLITASGSGLWAQGVQEFGTVSNTVAWMECQDGKATKCLDVVPNGSAQTGGLNIIGGEFRFANNGCGIHLNNVLSAFMFGGTIENGTSAGTGLCMDTTASDFSQYGTHYETNSTDILCSTGGQLTLTDVQFPGGSATNFDSTSCTALIKITGAHGTLNSKWIFGANLAVGSFFGESQVSGTSSTCSAATCFTNSAGGKLTLLGVTTRDGTVINNVIGYNSANQISRLTLTNQVGNSLIIQEDNTPINSVVTLNNDGVSFLTNSGGANICIPGSSSGTFCITPASTNTPSGTATFPSANMTVTGTIGSTSQKAETGSADANVLTVTPPSTIGTYNVCVSISVSSATSGVIGWTLSYTDSNGNAQSNVAQSLFQTGVAAPALTFTTSAAGNYQSCSQIDTNNAGANIIVKWVGGGTTAAKMSATVEKII